MPAAFLRVFNWGKLAPLLKAPSLLKGQYLACESRVHGRPRDDKATIVGGIPSKPDSVSHVASGSTDVADELAKNWTGHDLPVASLQVVRAEAEVFTV